MGARLILLANAAAIAGYMWCQGFERFWWESYGTWLLSPIIAIRLLPHPLNEWLLRAANFKPLLGDLLCVVPVVMFLASIWLGIRACRSRSMPAAVASCVLMSTIFVVYHSVKHMGIHLVVL